MVADNSETGRPPYTPDVVGLEPLSVSPHCWCIECVRRRATWHAAPTAEAAGTIEPPAVAEPPAPPNPADARLAEIENALTAARRELTNALEWTQYALDQARKARAGK